jgi:tetratricopeptide (TPR) repeat protein
MNKENILFSIIGLLLGFIVGFFFANTINQRYAQAPASASSSSASLPVDQHSTDSNLGGMPNPMGDVMAAIQKARNEPDNFEAQMEAAELYAQIRRYDQAIEFLERARKIRPDDYKALVRLGDFNFDAGRYEIAERWYSEALKKNPDDVNVRTDLGLTFFFRTPPDIDRAIAEFRRSLERDPNHEPTLQNLAIALLRKGETAEAQKTIERLEQVNPQNQALPSLKERVRASQEGK